jgi:hypothetical protein
MMAYSASSFRPQPIHTGIRQEAAKRKRVWDELPGGKKSRETVDPHQAATLLHAIASPSKLLTIKGQVLDKIDIRDLTLDKLNRIKQELDSHQELAWSLGTGTAFLMHVTKLIKEFSPSDIEGEEKESPAKTILLHFLPHITKAIQNHPAYKLQSKFLYMIKALSVLDGKTQVEQALFKAVADKMTALAKAWNTEIEPFKFAWKDVINGLYGLQKLTGQSQNEKALLRAFTDFIKKYDSEVPLDPADVAIGLYGFQNFSGESEEEQDLIEAFAHRIDASPSLIWDSHEISMILSGLQTMNLHIPAVKHLVRSVTDKLRTHPPVDLKEHSLAMIFSSLKNRTGESEEEQMLLETITHLLQGTSSPTFTDKSLAIIFSGIQNLNMDTPAAQGLIAAFTHHLKNHRAVNFTPYNISMIFYCLRNMTGASDIEISLFEALATLIDKIKTPIRCNAKRFSMAVFGFQKIKPRSTAAQKLLHVFIEKVVPSDTHFMPQGISMILYGIQHMTGLSKAEDDFFQHLTSLLNHAQPVEFTGQNFSMAVHGFQHTHTPLQAVQDLMWAAAQHITPTPVDLTVQGLIMVLQSVKNIKGGKPADQEFMDRITEKINRSRVISTPNDEVSSLLTECEAVPLESEVLRNLLTTVLDKLTDSPLRLTQNQSLQIQALLEKIHTSLEPALAITPPPQALPFDLNCGTPLLNETAEEAQPAVPDPILNMDVTDATLNAALDAQENPPQNPLQPEAAPVAPPHHYQHRRKTDFPQIRISTIKDGHLFYITYKNLDNLSPGRYAAIYNLLPDFLLDEKYSNNRYIRAEIDINVLKRLLEVIQEKNMIEENHLMVSYREVTQQVAAILRNLAARPNLPQHEQAEAELTEEQLREMLDASHAALQNVLTVVIPNKQPQLRQVREVIDDDHSDEEGPLPRVPQLLDDDNSGSDNDIVLAAPGRRRPVIQDDYTPDFVVFMTERFSTTHNLESILYPHNRQTRAEAQTQTELVNLHDIYTCEMETERNREDAYNAITHLIEGFRKPAVRSSQTLPPLR